MNSSITYHTGQRDAVLACFSRNSGKQLTAGDIAADLLTRGSRIGNATIYRTLDYLEKEGRIRKFIDENGRQACWQLTVGSEGCSDHYHLKCHKCGTIVHLECELAAQLDEHIQADHHFVIDRAATIFYGLCETCQAAAVSLEEAK